MAKRILVLEDEKEVGELYIKCLKGQGYDAVLAVNGLEGLRQIKEGRPDLILLDLGMPEMNGIEFYQYICDNHRKPVYPVLVLTGRNDLEAVFKDFQVDGFIIKPFKASRLLSEVDIIFNRQALKEKSEHAQKVMVVDNSKFLAGKIMEGLSRVGYKSEFADSGLVGIEKSVADPPDMVLANLGLKDIPGDMVILRLQAMARTRRIKCVLYVHRSQTLDRIVTDRFATKSGVRLLCEYDEPMEILEAVGRLSRQESDE